MAGSREVSAPTTLAPVLSFAGFMVENGQPLPEISKVHLSDVPSTVLACLQKFMKKVSVGTSVDRLGHFKGDVESLARFVPKTHFRMLGSIIQDYAVVLTG